MVLLLITALSHNAEIFVDVTHRFFLDNKEFYHIKLFVTFHYLTPL